MRQHFSRMLAIILLLGAIVASHHLAPSVSAAGPMTWIDPYCTSYSGGASPGYHWWDEWPWTTGEAYADLYSDGLGGWRRVNQDPGYQASGSNVTIYLYVSANLGGWGSATTYETTMYYSGNYFSGIRNHRESITCW